MPRKTQRYLLISILSISLQLQCSIAEAIQMRIIPRTHLTAGVLPDNTVLATIQFWGRRENCVLEAWNTFKDVESMPGEFTMSDDKGGMTRLNVKLSGENWQPNSQTGKGLSFMGIDNNTTLILSTRGEQFTDASTLLIDLTAICRSKAIN
ncbi:hypothetical protein QU24_02235 [Pantoea rodasii]|uniref:Uncharacterized protein n=2 Tax=Pantoea rodasii TaxID=1076549 RepID=A0A0B1RDH0_9GAMM|nr:hypothetical protein QU24_02235 [Pantoea rodasii]